ncbi:hypothetical protein BV25DRAFT_1828799 [Artomyces pyxidatus]|uniref:Uncharacterized protein n=1 Tax=Artomyces pyxidatus TaxID=48021 RepID=A0ACB8SSH7_9AGAM|nr:hypothetical protein BV25DRAFT_1828799 [Artomyces pyxidatus]
MRVNARIKASTTSPFTVVMCCMPYVVACGWNCFVSRDNLGGLPEPAELLLIYADSGCPAFSISLSPWRNPKKQCSTLRCAAVLVRGVDYERQARDARTRFFDFPGCLCA